VSEKRARRDEFVGTLVCGRQYRLTGFSSSICRLEEGHKGACGLFIMDTQPSTRTEDPLVRAVQVVIERRSKILAEEIIQNLLDALRALPSDERAAVILGTARAGMRGYASSSRHKRGAKKK